MNRIVIVAMTFLLAACSGQAASDHVADEVADPIEDVENSDDDPAQENMQLETEEKNSSDHQGDESSQSEQGMEKDESDPDQQTLNINEEIQQLSEFPVIGKHVDLSNRGLNIVEDNQGKRVMLISNEDDRNTHKTIYIKKNNRLKIIEFNKGQIFNEIIS